MRGKTEASAVGLGLGALARWGNLHARKSKALLVEFALIASPQLVFARDLADVGAYYFFSRSVSFDGEMSCASCHKSGKAMQDGYERALARKQVLVRLS